MRGDRAPPVHKLIALAGSRAGMISAATGAMALGLDAASATLVDRFAVHDKPGAVEQLMH